MSFGSPKIPEIEAAPEIEEPEIDTSELARKRKELQAKRMGRSKLRIEPSAGLNAGQKTGLAI